MLLLGIVIASGCEATSEMPNRTTRSALVPLDVGNEWTYLRNRYFRGSLQERDTFTLAVREGDRNDVVAMVRTGAFGSDTLHLRNTTSGAVEQRTDSGWTPIVDVTMPLFELYPVTQYTEHYTHRFRTGADTTVLHDGASLVAARIEQHDDLLSEEQVSLLKLDFEHLVVPGVGVLETRFVADLTQCQECSLVSQFYTYRLLRYSIK